MSVGDVQVSDVCGLSKYVIAAGCSIEYGTQFGTIICPQDLRWQGGLLQVLPDRERQHVVQAVVEVAQLRDEKLELVPVRNGPASLFPDVSGQGMRLLEASLALESLSIFMSLGWERWEKSP